MACIRVLTIDPGVNTGWAMWSGGKYPGATGVIRQAKEKNMVLPLPAQLDSLWQPFRLLLLQYEPDLVVIENCSFWQSSAVSHAALFRGDLRKLMFIIGGYCLLAGLRRIPWQLVEPQEWKGQLDDKALAARILRRIGCKYKQHEQEAVGIGLWREGRL